MWPRVACLFRDKFLSFFGFWFGFGRREEGEEENRMTIWLRISLILLPHHEYASFVCLCVLVFILIMFNALVYFFFNVSVSMYNTFLMCWFIYINMMSMFS